MVSDGIQCYTPRFAEGERLAAFRSPHNSPNNIVHLYNVYPERLVKYFSNIGNNVIVFNAIGTDTQARLNSQDCDSDFVYATNQSEMAELARTAYINYPTIINDIAESGSHLYHMTQADYAKMDNAMAATQADIGVSTDTAQLAMSYYYDSDMQDKMHKDILRYIKEKGLTISQANELLTNIIKMLPDYLTLTSIDNHERLIKREIFTNIDSEDVNITGNIIY